MDYMPIILISHVLFLKGWCKNGTLLAMNGCFKDSELRDDEKNNSIYIEQNYPGLCLQTCIHQKRTHPVAVALKDTSCLCLNRTNTKEAPETSTRNCAETCPGHDEMYCGHKTVNCYSSYLMLYNATDQTNENKCAAHLKGSSLLSMQNCSTSLPTFCKILTDGKCDEISTSANWSIELLECTGLGRIEVQYNTMGNNTESDACFDPHYINPGSYFGIQVTFWFPSFGQNAPPVPCPELIAPTHGNITLASNPRIAEYTCESGFKLIPNVTRFCLANRTWNGTTPICQKLETTTLITATTTEATAEATTEATSEATAKATTEATTEVRPEATSAEATADTTTKSLRTNMAVDPKWSLIIETTTSSPSPRVTSSPASSSTTLLTSSSSTTHTPIAQSASSSSESNNGQTIGIVVGVVGFCIIVAIVCIVTWCKTKKDNGKRKNTSNGTLGNTERGGPIVHAIKATLPATTMNTDNDGQQNTGNETPQDTENIDTVVQENEAFENGNNIIHIPRVMEATLPATTMNMENDGQQHTGNETPYDTDHIDTVVHRNEASENDNNNIHILRVMEANLPATTMNMENDGQQHAGNETPYGTENIDTVVQENEAFENGNNIIHIPRVMEATLPATTMNMENDGQQHTGNETPYDTDHIDTVVQENEASENGNNNIHLLRVMEPNFPATTINTENDEQQHIGNETLYDIENIDTVVHEHEAIENDNNNIYIPRVMEANLPATTGIQGHRTAW